MRPKSSLMCCSPIQRTGTTFPWLVVMLTPKIVSHRKMPSA